MPTTGNRVPVVTGHAIAAGLRELADEIQWNHDLAASMNVETGPRVAIHVTEPATVERFAAKYASRVTRAEVGDYTHVSATGRMEGLDVVFWASITAPMAVAS